LNELERIVMSRHTQELWEKAPRQFSLAFLQSLHELFVIFAEWFRRNRMAQALVPVVPVSSTGICAAAAVLAVNPTFFGANAGMTIQNRVQEWGRHLERLFVYNYAADTRLNPSYEPPAELFEAGSLRQQSGQQSSPASDPSDTSRNLPSNPEGERKKHVRAVQPALRWAPGADRQIKFGVLYKDTALRPRISVPGPAGTPVGEPEGICLPFTVEGSRGCAGTRFQRTRTGKRKRNEPPEAGQHRGDCGFLHVDLKDDIWNRLKPEHLTQLKEFLDVDAIKKHITAVPSLASKMNL
jgi:hypothetical protein